MCCDLIEQYFKFIEFIFEEVSKGPKKYMLKMQLIKFLKAIILMI